jgi:hypothetical protein
VNRFVVTPESVGNEGQENLVGLLVAVEEGTDVPRFGQLTTRKSDRRCLFHEASPAFQSGTLIGSAADRHQGISALSRRLAHPLPRTCWYPMHSQLQSAVLNPS